MKVCLIGLGYVGALTASGLASRSHEVVGVDVDPHKVEAILAGRSPVVEPGIEELIQEGVAAGRLTATTDLVEAMDLADVSLVCVGTPSAYGGGTDLAFVRRALDGLREAMATARPPASGFHTVVIRSTVPPGTGAELVAPLLAADRLPPGWEVATASCPEFLREGVGVKDMFDPPFVVIGASDPRAAAALEELFSFLELPAIHVDVPTAEALKYACNAFHAVKISFANEIARVFRGLGVDSRQVMEVFVQDEKLNISRAYLRPGFAFGGSCLPKDLRALGHMARTQALDVPLLSATTQTNEQVVREAVDRVLVSGARRVALFGLSFKADTDDLRESPQVELAERLIGKGVDVRIYDPIICPDRLTGANLRHVQQRLPHLTRLLCGAPEEALSGADLAVVGTAPQEVVAALVESPPRVVLDLHGGLGVEVERLDGYQGIGW